MPIATSAGGLHDRSVLREDTNRSSSSPSGTRLTSTSSTRLLLASLCRDVNGPTNENWIRSFRSSPREIKIVRCCLLFLLFVFVVCCSLLCGSGKGFC